MTLFFQTCITIAVCVFSMQVMGQKMFLEVISPLWKANNGTAGISDLQVLGNLAKNKVIKTSLILWRLLAFINCRLQVLYVESF